MTLVVLGLLLGMAGLLWIPVLAIMQADHQTKRESPREPNTLVMGAARRESQAA